MDFDVIILSLGVGLGLHKRIGIRHFVPIYLGITNVLPILLTLFLHADRVAEYKEHNGMFSQRHLSSSSEEDSEFDFIVVGGGAAGSVVANRLSVHFNVLLIEAGGNPNPLTYVPALDTTMLSRPQLDYAFRTVRQKSSCLSCNQQESIWNQGFGLGGSGMLNSMVYIRGHPYDFDNWAYYTNDKRWKYKNLLPYFLRSEDYCFKCDDLAAYPTPTTDYYHSTGGELPLMKPHDAPLLREFLNAMSWANVKIRDQNAPFYYSAANVAVYNQRRSKRSSAYTSFIEPILNSHRHHLKIWRHTRVIQVLFHPHTTTAYGVRFERFGKIGIITASKEIIISSGAVNSPKILMMSGIGPEEHLNELKIPVRVNLPVGKNLQDHFGTLVGPILIDKRASFIFERDVKYDSIIDFIANGTGPLTLPFPVANAFWSSTRAILAGDGEWPDIQVGLAPHGVGIGVADGLARGSNIRVDVLSEWLSPVRNQDAFFLLVDYGRPKSRGRITLASNDYLDDPRIDPGYYEDSKNEDIIVTVEALKKAAYIAENAPAFQHLGARLSPVPFPPCKDKKFKSSVYWECVARHLTLTFHHHAGTCSMARRHSRHAVVDPELRVIGTKRLRVIDSSVMPFVTTFNTHAPTIMIGERGADFVLEYWKNQVAHKSTKYMYTLYNKKEEVKSNKWPTLRPSVQDNATLNWGSPKRWFEVKPWYDVYAEVLEE